MIKVRGFLSCIGAPDPCAIDMKGQATLTKSEFAPMSDVHYLVAYFRDAGSFNPLGLPCRKAQNIEDCTNPMVSDYSLCRQTLAAYKSEFETLSPDIRMQYHNDVGEYIMKTTMDAVSPRTEENESYKPTAVADTSVGATGKSERDATAAPQA